MADIKHYVIRGGIEGRERLRVLGRVMHESTSALLDRLALADGQTCLDAGCGGGDVSRVLARRVGPGGRVLGVDLDETKLAAARAEAAEQGVANVEFRALDLHDTTALPRFDIVYARFLLTHLSDPAAMVAAFHRALRPGGTIAVEDIDFSGSFTWPELPAFRRYHELYCAVVRNRGGDPNIGPRLPSLLLQNGFAEVQVRVAQPVALSGESKLINGLTMENIAGPVIADGLATRDEIDAIVSELDAFASDPATLAGVPRIVQAWGRRS